MDPQQAKVEPERLVLKVGVLSIDLDGRGRGLVTLDGKEYAAASMFIRVEAGHPPAVDMTFYPAMLKRDGAGNVWEPAGDVPYLTVEVRR
jgi:hypothetical protein